MMLNFYADVLVVVCLFLFLFILLLFCCFPKERERAEDPTTYGGQKKIAWSSKSIVFDGRRIRRLAVYVGIFEVELATCHNS
jgi:hypothetical protein